MWASFPFFGGAFNNGVNVSPRYRNCNNGFSNSNWNYGSRPLLHHSFLFALSYFL